MLTESRLLYEFMIRGSLITERHLMIYLQAARKEYARSAISDLGHFFSNFNLADHIIKATSGEALRELMRTSHTDDPMQKWALNHVEMDSFIAPFSSLSTTSRTASTAPTDDDNGAPSS